MAERRPLVALNGRIQQLPDGDTVAGAGGGSAPAGIKPYSDGTRQGATLPGWVFDANGGPNEYNAWGNTLWFQPFVLRGSFTVNAISIIARSSTASLFYRVGITALSDNPWQPSGSALYRSTELVGGTGLLRHTLPSALSLMAGLYAVVFLGSDFFPVYGRAATLPEMGLLPADSNVGIISELSKSTAYAALPDPIPAWDTVVVEGYGSHTTWIFLD